LEIVPPTPLWHLRIPSRTRQRNKSWHLTAIRSKRPPRASVNTFTDPPGELELAPDCCTIENRELAPDCHLLLRTATDLLLTRTSRYETPLASANTFTNPPGEYRAGTSLPYTYEHGTPYPPILSANRPLRTTPTCYTLYDPLCTTFDP
jgi:hypothetical protein